MRSGWDTPYLCCCAQLYRPAYRLTLIWTEVSEFISSTCYIVRSNRYSCCVVGCTGFAKQNEDGNGLRATVCMIFCFTEQIIPTHTAESILTTSVADITAYIALRGKYVEVSSQSCCKTLRFRATRGFLETYYKCFVLIYFVTVLHLMERLCWCDLCALFVVGCNSETFGLILPNVCIQFLSIGLKNSNV